MSPKRSYELRLTPRRVLQANKVELEGLRGGERRECGVTTLRSTPDRTECAECGMKRQRRVCDVSAEYHLPDYTEPEPTRWPRPPKEEGEAAQNNVVISAGKRSCPDMICYLLSVQ